MFRRKRKPIDLSLYTQSELAEFLRHHSVDEWNTAAASMEAGWTANFDHFTVCKSEELNFKNRNLWGAKFRKADLRADFGKSDLRNAAFDDSLLSRTRFTEANLIGATFGHAALAGCCFARTQMKYVRFRYADLRGADLRGADLEESTFANARIDDAKIDEYTDFKGASFKGVDIADVNFQGANFHRSSFEGAHFKSNRVGASPQKITITRNIYQIKPFSDLSTILVLSTDKDPGYIIKHKDWMGDFKDLHINVANEYGADSVELRQAQDIVSMISKAVAEWPEVATHELPDIGKSDQSSYLNAEAHRTGDSPADIILGD